MARDTNIIASVDIGSSKIKLLIAEKNENSITILGYGSIYSAGVVDGEITDVAQVARVVSDLVKKVSIDYDIDIYNISVNIVDIKLKIINNKAQIPIANKVGNDDVKEVIKRADVTLIGSNETQLTYIVNNYFINEGVNMIAVSNPVGMTANVLQVELYIIIVTTRNIHNVEDVIRKSKLGIREITLSSLASSRAVVSQEDKNQGICLIDIGADVTNLAVFIDGFIVYNKSLVAGGNKITNYIALEFNTSFQQAEKLKVNYGHIKTTSTEEDKLIKFKQINDEKDYYLSSHALFETIEEAYLNLLNLIKKDLKGYMSKLKAGLILTGGGTKILDCELLCIKFFKIRTKKGLVNTDIIKPYVITRDHAYACSLGLLLSNDDDFI